MTVEKCVFDNNVPIPYTVMSHHDYGEQIAATP